MTDDLAQLGDLGVATLLSHQRNDWLDWIERGTLNWDDEPAYVDDDGEPVTWLAFHLDVYTQLNSAGS